MMGPMIELRCVPCSPGEEGNALVVQAFYETWVRVEYRCWKVNVGLGNRIGPFLQKDEDGRTVPEWTDWMPVLYEQHSFPLP